MQCCHQLTEWQDLEKAVTVNIDDATPPRLDKIWEDDYNMVKFSHTHFLPHPLYISCPQEYYLPHLIRSKVKLACCGQDDPNFSKFLNNSLIDPDKKQLLEADYSAELALYSILHGNLDRASYYNNISLQAFLRVCLT